ncbi:hypothetical protein [Streptomyces rhizosphaericus]|uniref:hypothetical protein n=1 Tax=Streptomyces rhizosphaericus TaxID=114699 RepID=UPI000A392F77|nr:hypothetical protein [Streptomyces rhizosphaericus]
MHDTIPAPAQADCLTAFEALRDGADPDTETTIELGEGCNRFPPSPDLARYLSTLLDRFADRPGPQYDIPVSYFHETAHTRQGTRRKTGYYLIPS